ncbi:hypothetical protein ACFFX0_07075 [Citricoccus parietis]|uniref:Uncharacterized protein n=1 Tax=Citricoccus parietis TaxID=592307 RepID=A0ABV5FWC4_9MICC
MGMIGSGAGGEHLVVGRASRRRQVFGLGRVVSAVLGGPAPTATCPGPGRDA